MNYEALRDRLVKLETFESKALVGAHDAPQELCDLVLAFALAYNDLRNVIFAQVMLQEVVPQDQGVRTRALGLANGLRTALIRTQCGLVHELLELVINSRDVRELPLFRKVVRQLSGRGRDAWKAVCDVAEGRQSGDPLAKALAILRNKVAFHYDVGELGRAYRTAFVEQSSHGPPLLSRGSRLVETRFYFADAAAQNCLFHRTHDEGARSFILGDSTVLEALHFALYEVVTRFIQARGYAWRAGE